MDIGILETMDEQELRSYLRCLRHNCRSILQWDHAAGYGFWAHFHLIAKGKGQRDRDLPMTPKLLEALRDYWRWARSKVYLFPSPCSTSDEEEPISPKTVWNVCHEAAVRAGLTKRIGPHTIRHSFATQHLDSGTDLRTIHYLVRYTHRVAISNHRIISGAIPCHNLFVVPIIG